ncbi:hypothetical protein CDAR_302521 [Caerostris darwini]|uniref:Uncharacterized protein n=1 Tax=Caerostris darwini TaxID=1538125 RepID=A0AAV4NE02_9ARAC|nr:hypothetical protein CDAR_302521 [Caerostris darwini]
MKDLSTPALPPPRPPVSSVVCLIRASCSGQRLIVIEVPPWYFDHSKVAVTLDLWDHFGASEFEKSLPLCVPIGRAILWFLIGGVFS